MLFNFYAYCTTGLQKLRFTVLIPAELHKQPSSS